MTPDADDQPLRLAVLDAEDLAVVSTLLHDGEVHVADMAFLQAQGRFALVASRFDWAAALKKRFERCQTGLHFERVLRVAKQGLRAGPDGSNRLLAIEFTPGDAPAGTILLSFMEGGQIRLDVECLEAEMRDIGPRWSVESEPRPVLRPSARATS